MVDEVIVVKDEEKNDKADDMKEYNEENGDQDKYKG